MSDLVVPLSSSAAADADLFGPKAANQAALGLAGLPIPGGFCLSADAYRLQLKTAGVDKAIAKLPSADLMEARLLTNDIRIGLFDSAIAPEILDPLLAARQELEERTGVPLVVRSSALRSATWIPGARPTRSAVICTRRSIIIRPRWPRIWSPSAAWMMIR